MEERGKSAWWADTETHQPAKVKRNWRGIVLATFLPLALILLLFSVVVQNPGRQPRGLANGGQELPPSLDALANACSGLMIFPTPPVREVMQTSGMENSSSWLTTPPTSGNYASVPAPNRFFAPGDKMSPSVTTALANLKNGSVVIWYLPQYEDSANFLRNWIETVPSTTPVLAAPWPLPTAETWPVGRKYVATSWGKKQSCGNFSNSVLDSFISLTYPNQ